MDILIKNGIIIDGTGSPGYKADILIKEDRIEKIQTDIKVNDYQVIDASNKVVAPGFIDMHSHGDLTILSINKAEATVMQGITTLVVGMCGIGMAPANEKVRNYYSTLVTRLFTIPNMQLYDTLQDYMEAIKKRGVSTNLAFFIPHGNVRICILGMEDRSPTPEELNEMKQIVRRGMEAGAFGLSTGLIYPPGSITPTEEIIELCKVVGHGEYNGIYDSHMRDEGANILDRGIGELIRIAKEANIRAHISHIKIGGGASLKLTNDVINLIKNARNNEGLFIHADLYPYEEVGLFLSAVMLRPWVFENLVGNLTNPNTRKKIAEESLQYFFQFLTGLPPQIQSLSKEEKENLIISYIKQYFRVTSVMKNHHIEGKYLGRALKILYPKRKFIDALLDFILDEQGSIILTVKFMDEKTSILSLFKQDFVCIGTDGFLIAEGQTHPRSYGTFPRILSNYIKEKKLLSIEEGIRKMTSLPASILGLNDRGIIKIGNKADLVVFDPESIKDKATYKNSRQYPEGIDYVIINGDITVANGKHLGILSGRILKHRKNY
ncbi:MAG: amidohydrolase family protein [Candidatus Hodarchaeota archaeon]